MEKSLQSWNQSSRLAKWNAMVTDCRNSGLTVRQWCEENHIAYSTYYKRLRRVYEESRKPEEPAGYYRVPQESAPSSPLAVIRVGELSAEIYAGADRDLIAAIVQAAQLC